MTQDLANKLIAHYEGVIEQIKNVDSVEQVKSVLFKTGTDCGVCLCAKNQFHTNVYGDLWIELQCTLPKNWAKIPYNGDSIPEIISLLQVRVDILKQFPN